MAARHYACSPLRFLTRIAEPLPRQPARASNAPPAPRAKFDFNSNLCQQYACHGLHGTAAHSPTRLQPHPPRELARPTRTVTQAPQGDGPSMRGRQNATPTPTVSVSSLETACKAVVSKSTGPRPQSPAHPSVKDKAFFPPKPPTRPPDPTGLHGDTDWIAGPAGQPTYTPLKPSHALPMQNCPFAGGCPRKSCRVGSHPPGSTRHRATDAGQRLLRTAWHSGKKPLQPRCFAAAKAWERCAARYAGVGIHRPQVKPASVRKSPRAVRSLN